MIGKEVKQMIAAVDTKGDGYVDYAAFQGLTAAPHRQVTEKDSTKLAILAQGDATSCAMPMAMF